MNSELRRIDYETLANNLASVLERVVGEQETVVVETAGGELALLRYLAPADSPLPLVPDLEACAAAAGTWADVDSDLLLHQIHESRQTNRPPVSL